MKSERISPFWVNGYQPFSALQQRMLEFNTDQKEYTKSFIITILYSYIILSDLLIYLSYLLVYLFVIQP